MRGSTRALLVCVAVLSAASARAADPSRLSLVQAQAEARAHSPSVAELEARLRGVQVLAQDAARVLRENPALSVGYESGTLSGESGEHAITAQLSWTVDVSGSWAMRRRAAEADVARTTFDREDGLRALDEAVALAVADLADAERAAARLARITLLDQLAAEAMRRKLAVGQGDQLQVDGADLDLAASRADLARAHGAIAIARAALGRLLGRRDSGGDRGRGSE